jgi:LytS/YehU family sensor histidine kinase
MTQTLPPFPDFLLVRLTAGLLVYCGTVAVLHAVAFHQRAARAAELERELARARLDALAAQVQPHFLFNALHTVGALVRTGESQKAVATLAGISDLLRYALDGSGVAEVSVREEIEIARRYLEIQSLRYGERLAVRFAVADDALDAGVPRLILQPLLENAIRHGAARSAGPAWIEVSASRADEHLRVAVRNSAPMDLAADPGAGIGLRSTRARLEQLHGSAFRMETGRTGDAYDAVIEIPWRPAGDVRSRG